MNTGRVFGIILIILDLIVTWWASGKGFSFWSILFNPFSSTPILTNLPINLFSILFYVGLLFVIVAKPRY